LIVMADGTVTLKGKIAESDTVVIEKGGGIVANGDLDILCQNDVLIHGSIKASAGSNASIRIATQGTLYIDGALEAGDGKNAEFKKGDDTATGDTGEPGGGITLLALSGIVIEPGARLRAGDGGAGATVFVTGRVELTLVSAVAGAGGSGGSIVLEAAEEIVVAGRLRAGNGGKSGKARASGSTDAVVEATTPNGATGGDIALIVRPGHRAGQVWISGLGLRAGDGGDVRMALVSAGGHARAQAGKGGRGGALKLSGAAAADIYDSAISSSAGNGGDGGDANQPSHHGRFGSAAEADGTTDAVAQCAGGGDAGSSYSPIDPAQGGDTAASRASAVDQAGQPVSSVDYAKKHQGSTAAGATRAAAP
jgi:hypothetical protein